VVADVTTVGSVRVTETVAVERPVTTVRDTAWVTDNVGDTVCVRLAKPVMTVGDTVVVAECRPVTMVRDTVTVAESSPVARVGDTVSVRLAKPEATVGDTVCERLAVGDTVCELLAKPVATVRDTDGVRLDPVELEADDVAKHVGWKASPVVVHDEGQVQSVGAVDDSGQKYPTGHSVIVPKDGQ